MQFCTVLLRVACRLKVLPLECNCSLQYVWFVFVCESCTACESYAENKLSSLSQKQHSVHVAHVHWQFSNLVAGGIQNAILKTQSEADYFHWLLCAWFHFDCDFYMNAFEDQSNSRIFTVLV